MIQPSLPHSDYQLIDFGLGRKLEQIGGVIVDRPCPGANFPQAGSDLWGKAAISFSSVLAGQWHYRNSWKSERNAWECRSQGLRFRIKPTPAGQIGIFPEHWVHWDWLSQRLHSPSPTENPMRVLSLFAYTGATTLRLAQQGVTVTHVDASKPTIQWAKENQKLSGLDHASIRWIVDDASAFVKRELRRGKQYEAIILDPPTYGHGAQGDRWEIHRDLMPLLDDCWQLLSEDRRGVLLCGHSSHISLREINRQLAQKHGLANLGNCDVTQAYLVDQSGRKLDCGFAAKYSFENANSC